jgi:hypothetical protein
MISTIVSGGRIGLDCVMGEMGEMSEEEGRTTNTYHGQCEYFSY